MQLTGSVKSVTYPVDIEKYPGHPADVIVDFGVGTFKLTVAENVPSVGDVYTCTLEGMETQKAIQAKVDKVVQDERDEAEKERVKAEVAERERIEKIADLEAQTVKERIKEAQAKSDLVSKNTIDEEKGSEVKPFAFPKPVDVPVPSGLIASKPSPEENEK